jgi:hypothetical protein
MSGIERLGHELWTVSRRLPIRGIGDLGSRMTIVRFDDHSLMLHSPVELDPDLLTTLGQLGEVFAYLR